jgi:hypothetical protein
LAVKRIYRLNEKKMKMTQFVATCLILFLSLKAVHSQTGCATPYISWVNKTYETTLESLSDREGTPRGYGKVTLPNPERMVPDPCIEITAPQTNQYIEVNLEVTSLTGNSYVCVTVNDSPEPSCGNGRVSYCGRAPTNDLIAKIFCDASCDLSDVELYYRVVLSPAVGQTNQYILVFIIVN